MNRTEERLRAATRAAARTVQDGSAPPLRLPAEPGQRPARRSRPPRSVWRRAVAPLAAATAVISVVGASVALTQRHGGQSGGTASSPSQLGLPPVAVLLTSHGPGGGFDHLQIIETMTGKRLASISPPKPDNSFCELTGSASSSRMFVALACTLKSVSDGGDSGGVEITPHKYIGIRLSRTGQVISERALPIPVPSQTEGPLAVSPDGSKLAMVIPGYYDRNPAIELFSTATGRLLHRWTWPGTAEIADRSRSFTVLSWTADSRTLAFPLMTENPTAVQIRLLDTTEPGSSLRASRMAVNFGPLQHRLDVAGRLSNSDTLITPDGRTIVSGTVTPLPHPPGRTLAITEFPARPGGPVRTLDPVTTGANLALYREVLWSNRDGSVIIASGFPGGRLNLNGDTVIGVVTRDGFRPLPGSLADVYRIAF